MTANIRILLTGPPKIGKTTVVERLMDLLRAAGVPTGGFVTSEVREGGVRVGFVVRDLDGPLATIAHVRSTSSIRVGKFGVNVREFEDVGLPALERALSDSGAVLVVDEIANMELASERFADLIMKALHADHPLVGTMHVREHPVTDAIRALPTVEIIEVTEANRDALPAQLAARFISP